MTIMYLYCKFVETQNIYMKEGPQKIAQSVSGQKLVKCLWTEASQKVRPKRLTTARIA